MCQAEFPLQQLCSSAWESCNGATPQTLHRCLCCLWCSSQGQAELCFQSFSSPHVSLGSFLLVPMATPTFGVTAMLLQPRQRHRSGRAVTSEAGTRPGDARLHLPAPGRPLLTVPSSLSHQQPRQPQARELPWEHANICCHKGFWRAAALRIHLNARISIHFHSCDRGRHSTHCSCPRFISCPRKPCWSC